MSGSQWKPRTVGGAIGAQSLISTSKESDAESEGFGKRYSQDASKGPQHGPQQVISQTMLLNQDLSFWGLCVDVVKIWGFASLYFLGISLLLQRIPVLGGYHGWSD
mmetsp:Transcript_698/g.1348  ORF Transcript_698/g.1348 Transcript_698/m.1348 type:complete len:106 (-) Transcript_698:53-370(-)|eukprot:CAMPEP_0181337366 /NCGR_PEP_ID=MMETSP1101-20121128/27972_1 /TAXON_ID=46948 /ORGANISM="Rhodomonas abbreviata, Strain Caron Lab Isolate" /LENGTH=105 /DNA_ID=CAMNT_0023447839 /DNA_START=20 /DNA_END=337 /DNA_ORIENTATION=-